MRVTCTFTENKHVLCNTLQLRQTSSQNFYNIVKFWLFGQTNGCYWLFSSLMSEVTLELRLGLFPYNLNDAYFEGGTRAKPIIYLKCLRSQTSLIKPIIPAERKSFDLQTGRFYFCKSTLSL